MWAFRAPDGTSADDLRDILAKSRDRVRTDIPVIAVGATVHDGKASLLVAASAQAVGLGLTANDLIKAGLPAIAGRGGGKDQFAQGGGTDVAGVDAALAAIAALVAERVGQ